MAIFIGNIEAKADAKGRIFIPSAYRKQMQLSEGNNTVIMRKDPDNNCIVIYPETIWNNKLEDFKSRLNEWDAQDQMLLMQFVSDAEILEIDNQGRILIQRKYLLQIGIENEVLFVGGIDRFNLWSKNEFEKTKLSSKDFAKLLKEKMSTQTKVE